MRFTTEQKRKLYGEQCYNLGLSVLRVKRRNTAAGWRSSRATRHNRRMHLLSGPRIKQDDGNIALDRGVRPRTNRATRITSSGTGPAAKDVFKDVNSDGLGKKIIGTGFNCSGGVTPWGTIFSAEENFQGGVVLTTGTDQINLASSFYWRRRRR